ncbi:MULTISPECIES: hypothetical protein [unclassified Roseovarius]|uniref:hypothetical protein n=1 Tax=unclassified Roseovarius TaxID=2614913 RepID=UPI00273EAE50|nr:hypothetical protein [Roseovarius sp. MMSF_3350]
MKRYVLAAVAALAAGPLAAGELATGDEITSAISGNTVQGDMSDGTAYTEFYDTDGTIRGADYTGNWRVSDDKMCFDYGEGENCWGVSLDGEGVSWMNGDVSDGTGTILDGNPNEF